MKTTTVKLEDRDLEIVRLPLRKYAELLATLKELPKLAESMAGKGNDQLLQVLPELITQFYPDFINIFVIATNITKEEAEELSLIDAVNIMIAVYEVNDYSAVYDSVKKVTARPAKTEQMKEIG